MIVTEIRQYRVEANTKDEAIIKRRAGVGVLISSQDVASVESKTYPITEPVPMNEWPPWAKLLRRVAEPDDTGIGDVVARVIGSEKSDAFKKWYKITLGKDCGCDGRQLMWNCMYPLKRLI